MDQVQPEVTQEQLLTKAGLIPPGLPGFLRYLTCLALADLPAFSPGAYSSPVPIHRLLT